MQRLSLSLAFSVLSFFLPLSLVAGVPDGQAVKQAETAPTKPLSFIENKGQITDQHGVVRTDIDFKLATPGMNMFIGAGQIHYQWYRQEDVQQGDSAERKNEAVQVEMYRMDVVLEGANAHAEVLREEKQGEYEQYYLPTCPDGVLAHSYARVVYKDIYPSIDWVVYSKNNQVKYDFVVRPGGDPAQIRLRYEGATNLNLLAGKLIATTPMGSITEQAPFSYEAETGRKVASGYTLDENRLGFDLGRYNGKLVIDPVLEWASYYGGGSESYGYGGMDAAGNVFLTGITGSATNIATTGAYQTTINGQGAIFLVKFNAQGVRQWGTYFGTKDMYAPAVSCDAAGNVFMACTVDQPTAGIATSGAHQTSHSGWADAFLVKFSPAGTRLWGSYYGGAGHDENYAVACDPLGNVYIGGRTHSSTGIASTGSHQASISGSGDGYIAKFSPSGVRLWASYYGGAGGGDEILTIACDPLGNMYAGGIGVGVTGIATTGSFMSTPQTGGSNNSFLTKFNASGVRQWGTYYYNNTVITAIACNATDVFITGETNNTTNGFATTGVHQTSFAGDVDAFVARFDGNSGWRLWGSYFGGAWGEIPKGMVIDAGNRIFISGSTRSPSGISTVGSHQSSFGGGYYDGFLAEFDLLGNSPWSSYYGGVNNDFSGAYLSHQQCGNAVSTNGASIALAGYTQSSNAIATPGAHQSALAGTTNAFVARFKSDTMMYIMQPFVDTAICQGGVFNLPYGVTDSFYGGNVFTAQLSDADGSFANPVVIGSITAVAADTIVCTIPANTLPGNGYRVRVVSSTPARTSQNNGYDIRIKALPLPVAGSNSPVCAGGNLALAATAPAGSSYAWTGPGGFSNNTQNPSISNMTTAMAGDYVVTATKEGCTAKDTMTVAVTPLPATPLAANNGPLCPDDTLNLSINNPLPNGGYNWTGPAAFSSSAVNPVIFNVNSNHGGSYTVTVTANGCTSLPGTTNVTIKPTPATPTANSNSPVCLGGVLNLSASSSPGSSYSWTGPNGYTATVQNPSISPVAKADEGIYTVVATLNGCPSAPASTGPVEVNVAAIVGAYASPGDTVCAGTNVQFVGFPQGAGTNPVFAWYKNGSVVSTSKVYRDSTLVAGDKVWCTVTATGICTTPVVVSTDTFRMVVLNIKTHPKVTIQATPEPTGDPDQGIVFLAVATHGGPEPKYQWYINDVPTGGNTLNISMAGVVIGTEIKVEMMSDDPCADQPYAVDSLLVQFPTGIDGHQGKGGISLYPNPNKGSFTISGVTANELNVSIVNALGQEVYSARYAGVNGSQAIDARLVPGNYLIKLQTEGGMEVLRFVVD